MIHTKINNCQHFYLMEDWAHKYILKCHKTGTQLGHQQHKCWYQNGPIQWPDFVTRWWWAILSSGMKENISCR
jgi:hypothetical protein